MRVAVAATFHGIGTAGAAQPDAPIGPGIRAGLGNAGSGTGGTASTTTSSTTSSSTGTTNTGSTTGGDDTDLT